MFLLGYDVGSSSIKATLLSAETGEVVASAVSPKTELEIQAPRAGWAEQDPEVWWQHIKLATAEIVKNGNIDTRLVQAIGISYQMHGLVIVDKNYAPLRPAIIWCDSRAVEIGERAYREIGAEKCLKHFLNSPGNFTASKLKWVQENEPDIYHQIYKAMLPGDFIAMKMTGEIKTTPSGLSEGIMWDFQQQHVAEPVLDYYGIAHDLIAEVADTLSVQGELTKAAAAELGLQSGIKISYRAGDQPNNALSLNVLNPGELAATAGTSGVVYGVGDQPNYDSRSRVNTFVHVNHDTAHPRYGVLLCVNGTGILNSWLKHNFTGAGDGGLDYSEMNELASQVPVGSDGVIVLPFGNGAERTLENKDTGASIHGLNFNRHQRAHVLRAAQEGIVFALNYGIEIMREMGLRIDSVRAGQANMFLSPLFTEAFATVTDANVELYNTDGSQGAARGAGIGAGIFQYASEAFVGLKAQRAIEPNLNLKSEYVDAYARWRKRLERLLSN